MARIEQDQFQDDEIYPVEESGTGRNAFYHQCEVVGHRPAYCICVGKVHAYNRGQRNFWPECITAMEYNQCGAVKMLAEEVAKGQAIHFINRIKLAAFNGLAEERANARFVPRESNVAAKPVFESAHVKAMFDGPPPAKAAPVPLKKSGTVLDHIDDTGYATAINAAIKENTATPVTPIAGESLLDMARRMMNK